MAATLPGIRPAAAATAPAAAPLATVTPVGQLGFSGHAGLYGWGATTLLDGSVLVGDYWNLRVLHYTPAGASLGQLIGSPGRAAGQNQAPYGLGVDPATGDVYVCDTDLYRVDVYTSTGQYRFSFGSRGTGPGQFLYPSRVAISPQGTIYVADSLAHSIRVYHRNPTAAPTYSGSFGGLGSGPGQFQQPHGMALDGLGRLWVADEGNWRVQVFDAAGAFLFQLGSRGSAKGQFRGDLRGVAIDQRQGWAYVSDAAAGRINKFDMAGNFLKRWGSLGTGDGQFEDGGREITVDGNGNVWVGDLGNFRAQVFSPSGSFLFALPSPPAPPPLGGFNGPRGIALDGAGNAFVTDTYNERVQKFDASGNALAAWGMRGSGPTQLNYPRLIATDPRNGDVVIANTDSNSIVRYGGDGSFKWSVGRRGSGPGQFSSPYGVAVGPDGTIYVADSQNARVVVLDPEGAFISAFGFLGTGSGQFQFPRGIALDPDGTLWVSDMNRNNVQHFSASGSYLGAFGTVGSGPGQLRQPFGVVSDGQSVWVADTANDRVEQWTTAGQYVGYFGSAGAGAGQLDAPQGLALGAGGAIYVVEQLNDRVSVWGVA